jgi:MarR family transcriptional regulator, lower aerobic nicotinate degradation pathway regulator
MTRYDLIKFFIDKVEAYEKEQADPNKLSVEDFNDWMFQSFLKAKGEKNETKERDYADGNEKNINLSVLIGTLFRYVKSYSKKVFETSAVQTIDEFTYLAILLNDGNMSKSELISRNVHEKTTGMEIIRRLINHNFIIQTNDPNDKRSQIIAITDTGKIEIFKLFKEMSKVSTIVSGNLSNQEKTILSYLLEKLDIFHRHIYDHEKKEDLDFLMGKYFG